MEVLCHLLLRADKGMCGYLQAQDILLSLLSALLLIQIPLMLSFKLELGNEFNIIILKATMFWLHWLGFYPPREDWGERTELAFGKLEKGLQSSQCPRFYDGIKTNIGPSLHGT